MNVIREGREVTVARVYLRVSTDEQDLARQEAIVTGARATGYYVASVYLPLAEAELLVATIRAKGARLAVPGIVDLSDLVTDSGGVARIVLEAVQDMLLRVALQTARDDYETRRERQREGIEIAKRAGRYNGRKPDLVLHRRIIGLRETGMSIARTAELAGCSIAQVKRVTAFHRVRAPSPENIIE
ncbi:resolvase [Sphingomonas metalli]|uniref:Resolvase n=1 Tax=Sphingomonas metalli TaxID=1779358 RepID=A0A916TB13_9SPHN|nr:helix-turn-helix domain-containing protein [Sphingomonas metalli]GGB38048.1 resolvase [Sphingomonas metalli]